MRRWAGIVRIAAILMQPGIVAIAMLVMAPPYRELAANRQHGEVHETASPRTGQGLDD